MPIPPPAPAPALSLPSEEHAGAGGGESFKLFGSFQEQGAYTTPAPAHGSKFKSLLEVGASGSFSEAVKWKISGRFWYDAIYDVTSFYPQRAKDDGQWFYGLSRDLHRRLARRLRHPGGPTADRVG